MFWVLPFFVATNIVNNFIFEQVKKVFLAKTLIIMYFFTQTFVIKLSKIRVWDPGFGIRAPGSRKKPIPESRIQGQKDTGSRIRIRNTADRGANSPSLIYRNYLCYEY
jgi:hypothetical protein